MRVQLLILTFMLLTSSLSFFSPAYAAPCGELPAGCDAGYSCVVQSDGFATCLRNEGFVPLADVTGSDLNTLYETGDGNLVGFLNRIFSLALTVGGILAVFRIAWGGYLYMTTDLWSSKERAKETLRDTVLGLLLLIAVWTILNQINPDILNLNVLEVIESNPIEPSAGEG